MTKVRHFQAIAESRREYSDILKKPNDSYSIIALKRLGYYSISGEFMEDYLALEYLSNLMFMSYRDGDLYKPSAHSVQRVFKNILRVHEVTIANMRAITMTIDAKKILNKRDKNFRGMCELYPERFRTNDIWVQKLPEVLYRSK